MHFCAVLVMFVKSIEQRKLDWMQKKDLPTQTSYNIINNTFVFTVKCPSNMPLFKLIVKSLV